MNLFSQLNFSISQRRNKNRMKCLQLRRNTQKRAAGTTVIASILLVKGNLRVSRPKAEVFQSFRSAHRLGVEASEYKSVEKCRKALKIKDLPLLTIRPLSNSDTLALSNPSISLFDCSHLRRSYCLCCLLDFRRMSRK